ncbi:MAG: DUF5665 domain-containing protein [Candidatus Peregrinibacteria bacterium]|nr:DUF5665 domain-containing protein [Candidatus Peregrinibacteria bacterium]MDZ4245031.1 DUF5665 domain-containing protein [Candidatus Gracilibacteria bacterium]
MAKKNTKKMSDEIEAAEKALNKAARKIEKAGLRDYVNFLSSPWRVFGVNFLVGTARGLGLIIGVSMVIAIVGYVITKILVDLPIVGEFFSSFYEFLKANGFPDPGSMGSDGASSTSGLDTSVVK